MATKRPRYMISVSDEMFNEIEDFRFRNRYQTRSEATAELIRLGLEVIKEQKQVDKEKTVRVFTAARSKDNQKMGYEEIPESKMRELEEAEEADDF